MIDDVAGHDEQTAPEERPVERESVPQPEPDQPTMDIDSAYEVIARTEGWDPRLTRYQIEEHKRRVQEFEREKKEWERQRSRYEPQEESNDPYMRRMDRIERVILEREERERKREEQDRLVSRLSSELQSAYTALSRMNGLTKQQMEERSEEFYDTLREMYPAPEMLHEIGVERASRNVFRVLGVNGSGYKPKPNVSGRGPTATRTIPGSPQPFTPGGMSPHEESMSAEQLEGETDEQYRARLERIISGAKRIPEGVRLSTSR